MKKKQTLSLLWRFLKGAKRYFLVTILAAGITALADMLQPQIIRAAIDCALGGKEADFPTFVMNAVNRIGGFSYLGQHLWIMALAVLIVALVQVVSQYTFRVFNTKASETLVKTMRDQLFSHIQHLPFSWHIANIVNNTDSEEICRSESMLQTIAMSISSESNIARLSSEIYKKAEKLYDNEEGVSHDMITYYADTYHNALHSFVQDNTNTSLGANTTGLKLLDALQFIRINSNNEVEVDVFNHGNQDIEEKFYEHIRRLSIGLDIDLNELVSYSTKFTNCDHGVISACLLFQATLFSYYLAQYSKKHQDLQLAWHGLAGYDDLLNGKCMDDYAEVIFAILLHNVYTHESNPEYGVVYQHSIDNNMFSFFCAFCDTFQKWHRPKQIDHSRTSLPDKHFLGEKFDLIITEDKICLKCNTQDAMYIRQSLIEEDKYLPGIKHFVQIIEY